MNDLVASEVVAEATEVAEAYDWRAPIAGGDEAFSRSLSRFADEGSFGRHFRSIEKQAAEARRRKAVVPSEWSGYYEKLSPAIIDRITDDNRPRVETMLRVMHSTGVDIDEAAAAIDAVTDQLDEIELAIIRQDKDDEAMIREHIEREIGPREFARLTEKVRRVFPKQWLQLCKSMRCEDGTLAFSKAEFIVPLMEMADKFDDDPPAVVSSVQGNGAADEIARMRAEMRDTRSTDPNAYWNNADKRERYRQLIEKGKA